MGNTESFVPTQMPPQVPREYYALSKQEAKVALEEAEAKDNYRWRCETCAMNTAARRMMDYSPRDPAAGLNYELLVAGEGLPKWLKAGMPAQLRVVTLANSADGGMPHTRAGGIVCLPQHIQPVGPSWQTTFNHECIHVHQRERADEWNQLYREVWQMEPYTGHIPQELEGRRRFNPDTLWAGLYIWRGRWVPVPIYARPESPVLGAIKVAWVDVVEGRWQSFAPPEFEADFGALTTSEQEHPHELAAYWLSTPTLGQTSPARARMEAAVQK